MKRFRLVLVAAAACLAVAVLPAAVGAGTASTLAHVTCGEVITADTTLDADLECFGETPGVVIGADGITLDLNGHTIAYGGDLETAGVVLTGREGVTVQNGSVHEFAPGVDINGGSANVVRSLRIATFPGHTKTGILLQGGTRLNVVTDNIVFNAGPAIWLRGASSNQITLNRVLRSGNFGIYLTGDGGGASGGGPSAGNLVKQNILIAPALGIALAFEPGARNKLRGNRIVRPRLFGITVTGSDGTLISGNTITAAGETSNPTTAGIEVRQAANPSLDNNAVVAAAPYGIKVYDGSQGVSITRNKVEGSFSDGIRVEVADATVTANVVTYNAQYGIFAVPGVTDGGGNTGHDNGIDCFGVVCP